MHLWTLRWQKGGIDIKFLTHGHIFTVKCEINSPPESPWQQQYSIISTIYKQSNIQFEQPETIMMYLHIW